MVEFLIDQALKEAIDLHNRNQLDDARSLYNKIIEHDKSNSDAYHLLSLINLVSLQTNYKSGILFYWS